MLKFDEAEAVGQRQCALALRGRIEELLMLSVLKDTRISVGLALAVHGFCAAG